MGSGFDPRCRIWEGQDHLPDHVGFFRVLRIPPMQTTPWCHHTIQWARFV